MAPVVVDSSTVKLNKCGNSSSRVRVVGKIRQFTVSESESLTQNSKPWISVKKPQEDGSSEKCTVSLDAQSTCRKNEYELDYCYNPDEDLSHIYSREIKPLISKLFDGQNTSIVAIGAKRSGKTFSIQGSQEKPGLAVMAISEILQTANELGKSVSISLFTVVHDQAYDLLNPKHLAVQVMEDAQGRINLKGLFQVTVTSVSEFCDMYFRQGGLQKSQKVPHLNQLSYHKCLMVQILSKDDTLKTKKANKIHFVDLAGYEDPRKNKNDGVTLAESNRVNKSLYALVNVVSAINANDVRVPYRESKLTRILQDSLGGTSHVLLLTCLNPFFCHDSISSLSLVARLCQSTKQALMDSTNRIQNSSLKSGKVKSASFSGNKHLASSKRGNLVLKGREPVNEEKVVNPMQALKDKSIGSIPKPTKDIDLEESLSDSINELPNTLSSSLPNNEVTLTLEVDSSQNVNLEEIGSHSICELSNTISSSVLEGEFTLAMKEDSSPVGDFAMLANANNKTEGNRSPLLSERIREISSNLKKLCTSTPPLPVKVPKNVQSYDILEPKTPVVEANNAMCGTPQSTFSNRSSVMKQVLVQDYLNFLNSANKEELKCLKGIGEKRATYILELRENSPEPFKSLDDLQDIGLSAKQIKGMMRQAAGALFN